MTACQKLHNIREAMWPSGLGRWIWNLEFPGSNPPPYCFLHLLNWRVLLLDCIVQIANWSASHQLGFLKVNVILTVFAYLFTVSPISTAVPNTLDT